MTSGTRSVLALVPAFNPQPALLRKSLQSLLDQSSKIDILVVDDGSATPVADQCPADSRISVLRLTSNCGITRALIFGVEYGIAEGYDYLCRLDIGDISLPERIARQLAYMEDHPEVDLLGCRSRVLDLQGKVLFYHGVAGGPECMRSYLRLNSPFKHSTFFIRSSAMVRFGNYNDRYPAAQDYERLLCIAESGAVACLSDVLIDYLDDPAGLSAKKRTLQLMMRLRAQIKYADAMVPKCYFGVARTLALLVTPHSLAKTLSKAVWRQGRLI